MGQYGDLARWYDPLYASLGKDPAAEATALLAVAADLGVAPTSLLDVACGTGAHLETFDRHVPEVVGVDISQDMLAVARGRLPHVLLRHGDMRGLDLGRTFDVVTCLFSAIGHVRDEDDLHAAIGRMAAHVAPGGVLLVEPWIQPDQMLPAADEPGGHRGLTTVTTADGVVARALRSTRRGQVLVIEFAWAVADATGVHTAQETFRMPMFTREHLLSSVERAGLEASWQQPEALHAGRGLLVGRRPA